MVLKYFAMVPLSLEFSLSTTFYVPGYVINASKIVVLNAGMKDVRNTGMKDVRLEGSPVLTH